MDDTIFALVDCNNFYVSCERLFNPKLTGQPVIVMSNNDGCVVARSEEAKQLGIPMGIPIFQIKDAIQKHRIHTCSSNYALYGDISQRVMEVLSHFTPEIENYSIDESFLVLNGFEKKGLNGYAESIRDKVKQWTGIPISIGIAPTKTLAKVANKLAKRDRLGIMDMTRSPGIDEILDRVSVRDIWGIGSKHANFLKQYEISTAKDLKYANDDFIRSHLTVMGLRTVWELRGISCVPLEMAPPPRKNVCCSKSFNKPTDALDEIQEAIATYLTTACEKLRAQGSLACCLNVFLSTTTFQQKSTQYSASYTIDLPVPSSNTTEILYLAHKLLDRIYRKGYKYIKTGVILLDLIPSSQMTLDLFYPVSPRNNKICEVIDQINKRIGRDTIYPASTGIERPWRMMRRKLSPRYTTRFNEILTIKI